MYTDMVPKISCQLRIGNVYPKKRMLDAMQNLNKYQFLIGNVYHR